MSLMLMDALALSATIIGLVTLVRFGWEMLFETFKAITDSASWWQSGFMTIWFTIILGVPTVFIGLITSWGMKHLHIFPFL